MPFIDELKFYAEAGRGGDGVVRWRQEKFVPKGGPAGGDGGRGGDFYIEAVRDIHLLSKYKAKKEFKAGRGEDGGKKSLHGASGKDFYLQLPVGSVVTNLDTDEVWSLEKEGEKIMILRGGYGGFGNEHFKSSTNTTPQQSRAGQEGAHGHFSVELKLFADIGFIGLPNAGKSSLLNALTNAKAEVGDYPFTTLDPNLGDFYGYVLADIPGLIEGASEGRGLGIKFLRHISRTRLLVHLVSFDPEAETASRNGARNASMLKNYRDIRKELAKYDKKLKLVEDSLSDKKEIIILSKSDSVDQKTVEKKIKEFKKLNTQVLALSLYDDKLIKKVSDTLVKFLRK